MRNLSQKRNAIGSISTFEVKVMLTWWRNHLYRTDGDCKKALKEVVSHNKLTLPCKFSPYDICDNIKTDKLSWVGANGECHKDPESMVTSDALVNKLTNRCIHSEVTRHCKEALGMLYTKAFIRVLLPPISRTPLILDRDRLRAVIGTISGHWITRSHMATLDHADNGLCRWCRLV